ncbi:MAG TPA: class I SAM-dependent methyltransferase [Actinomycetota bacterium]|nr:class I SAM-dependent methyltransferase [Actinomycetota bacterium]
MNEPDDDRVDTTDGAGPTDGARPAAELVAPWIEFANRRTFDHTQVFPPDDETLQVGSAPERLLKRLIARVIRPVVRRYDRLLAESAAMNAELARSVAATQATVAELVQQARAIANDLREVGTMSKEHDVRIGRAATELELLADRMSTGSAPVTTAPSSVSSSAAPATDGATGPSHVLPDAFYWRFETALRGRPEAVAEKLGAYRELARELRDRHGADALWLDLGCGEGAFMELLREWGWRVVGMDHSPQAVEACAVRGLEAVEGSLPEFLLAFEGEPPAAISLIQVIEHLPTETWLPTLRYAERLLAPAGALVIETIDPRNPEALQAFFADVTHTWAAHPGTLEVMAGFAGFADTMVKGLNPGEDGRAQDFALVARKA